MPITLKGDPSNISSPITGIILSSVETESLGIYAMICYGSSGDLAADKPQIKAIVTNHTLDRIPSRFVHLPAVCGINNMGVLQKGDIITIFSDGVISVQFRESSDDNTLFFTDNCNNNCLMCPQPPRNTDNSRLIQINKEIIPLIPKDTKMLGITGGEPTLLGNDFVFLLNQIKKELPETNLHVLTNGRAFSSDNFLRQVLSLEIGTITWGIPLHSDYYALHNFIAQSFNAYEQTMLGIYNLARYNQKIELRIVLNKLTVQRLYELSRFIYRNLTFVGHIAIMSQEVIGNAIDNYDMLFTRPDEYNDVLAESVLFLTGAGFAVSLYNFPLCFLPQGLWQYAEKSISLWKRNYWSECSSCLSFNQCGGMFQSSIGYFESIRDEKNY